MRFGIMAMQIDSLVPSGLPAENVLAHIAGFDLASLSRSLAEKGFNPVELGSDLASLLPQTFRPSCHRTPGGSQGRVGSYLHRPPAVVVG